MAHLKIPSLNVAKYTFTWAAQAQQAVSINPQKDVVV
jgi:hypothetical protein